MPTVSTFVPKDYEIKESGSDFMKLEDGDNKFRVLTDALIGVEGWKDNKPFRRAGVDASIDPSEVDIDQKYGKPKINSFWAFMVYSYRDEKVMLLQINQKTIQKAILGYAQDEDWGHPNGYDLTVTREDNGGRVSYSVKPHPIKPLAKAVQTVVDEATPNFDVAKALNIEDAS